MEPDYGKLVELGRQYTHYNQWLVEWGWGGRWNVKEFTNKNNAVIEQTRLAKAYTGQVNVYLFEIKKGKRRIVSVKP
jgi:hypothetical protein